jgi:FkbM family methyltransferase
MELLLHKLNQKINIKGIIQVGSNTGQECSLFRDYTKNIICFEPIPHIFETLKNNNPDVICFNLGLGDVNEIKTMNISSNNGESSSFLKPLNHLQYYNVDFNETMNLEIKRFDSLEIDITNHNIIISDTQGYEINVLKGFGDKLKNIDGVIIEYINSKLYEGDSSLDDISNYLKNYNFILEDKNEGGVGWGNALYIKN